MKSKAIISFVLAFLLVTILTPLGQTEASTSRVAIISEFKGTVEVKKSGGKKKLKAFKKMSLNQGDEVTTGDDSTVTLKFSNGTDEDDTLMLDKNTTVTFSKVSNKQGTVTKVTMKKGNAWVDVKSIKNKNDEFTLETPTAVMGVRGTHFMVSIDPRTGIPTLFVSSGKVAVNSNQQQPSPENRPVSVVYPAMQLMQFPEDSGLSPEDMISFANFEELLRNTSPDIIAAILKNKAEIDKENDELISSLFNDNDITGLDFSDPTQFEKYKKNVELILLHLLKSANDSGKMSEEQINQIIDEANRKIADQNRQYDLNRELPPIDRNAGISAAEEERRLKAQEEARKKAEQKQNLQQQQQKRQQELIAEMERKRQAIEEQNRKAAEDARKRAEEQYKQQLNDAQKQALEERMRQREQEDRRPTPPPPPPAPTPAPPRPPIEYPIPESWESNINLSIDLVNENGEYVTYIVLNNDNNNSSMMNSSRFPVKTGYKLELAKNFPQDFTLLEARVNGVVRPIQNDSQSEVAISYPATVRQGVGQDTLKLTFERTRNDVKERGTYTVVMNYIEEPHNIFDITHKLDSDPNPSQLVYSLNYEDRYEDTDDEPFEFFIHTEGQNQQDEPATYTLSLNNSRYQINGFYDLTNLEIENEDLEDLEEYAVVADDHNIYHITKELYDYKSFLIYVQLIGTDQTYKFRLSI